MRQITKKAAEAFLAGRPMAARNNTSVTIDQGARSLPPVVTLRLHGHAIAWREPDGVAITLSGWPTSTTRERLNGLLQEMGSDWRITQREGDQYISKRAPYGWNSHRIGTREVLIVGTGDLLVIGGEAVRS